jgi:hypothetical protein
VGTFDQRMLWRVLSDPAANSEHVNPLFSADAGDRDINRIDQLRGRTIGVDAHDCQAAADSGINAKDVHDIYSAACAGASRSARSRRQSTAACADRASGGATAFR